MSTGESFRFPDPDFDISRLSDPTPATRQDFEGLLAALPAYESTTKHRFASVITMFENGEAVSVWLDSMAVYNRVTLENDLIDEVSLSVKRHPDDDEIVYGSSVTDDHRKVDAGEEEYQQTRIVSNFAKELIGSRRDEGCTWQLEAIAVIAESDLFRNACVGRLIDMSPSDRGEEQVRTVSTLYRDGSVVEQTAKFLTTAEVTDSMVPDERTVSVRTTGGKIYDYTKSSDGSERIVIRDALSDTLSDEEVVELAVERFEDFVEALEAGCHNVSEGSMRDFCDALRTTVAAGPISVPSSL